MTPAARVRRARLSLLAVRDLEEATRWVARNQPGATRSLRDAVRRLGERLAEYPRLGPLRPDLGACEVRVVPLTGLPYVLIYEVSRSGDPLIPRVVHGARELPGSFGPS